MFGLRIIIKSFEETLKVSRRLELWGDPKRQQMCVFFVRAGECVLRCVGFSCFSSKLCICLRVCNVWWHCRCEHAHLNSSEVFLCASSSFVVTASRLSDEKLSTAFLVTKKNCLVYIEFLSRGFVRWLIIVIWAPWLTNLAWEHWDSFRWQNQLAFCDSHCHSPVPVTCIALRVFYVGTPT